MSQDYEDEGENGSPSEFGGEEEGFESSNGPPSQQDPFADSNFAASNQKLVHLLKASRRR